MFVEIIKTGHNDSDKIHIRFIARESKKEDGIPSEILFVIENDLMLKGTSAKTLEEAQIIADIANKCPKKQPVPYGAFDFYIGE